MPYLISIKGPAGLGMSQFTHQADSFHTILPFFFSRYPQVVRMQNMATRHLVLMFILFAYQGHYQATRWQLAIGSRSLGSWHTRSLAGVSHGAHSFRRILMTAKQHGLLFEDPLPHGSGLEENLLLAAHKCHLCLSPVLHFSPCMLLVLGDSILQDRSFVTLMCIAMLGCVSYRGRTAGRLAHLRKTLRSVHHW